MEILKKNKYFIVASLILLISIVGYCYSQTKKAEQINVSPDANVEEKKVNYKLLIDTGSEKYEFSGTEKEGTTVFDALKKASSDNNFSFVYQESSLGAFVEEIHRVKNDMGTNKYWMFKVNGQLANEGASSLKVNNNDVIEWYYGEVSGY